MSKEFTPSDWLRIITSTTVSASDIALCEGCDIKTARKIVLAINKGVHKQNTSYICDTDKYLSTHRHTTRAREMALVFGKDEQ